MNLHSDEDSRFPRLFGALAWAAAAVLALVATAVAVLRVERIGEGQVGVLVGKWTGKAVPVLQTGKTVYSVLTRRLYVLDKTPQILEMAAASCGGALTVTTADGSEVEVDVTVRYRILPEQAHVVLATSGPGDLYKDKWVRATVRNQVRSHLGALAVGEMGDGAARDRQLALAQDAANEFLEPYALRIDSIALPVAPRFPAEHEVMVREREQADRQAQAEEARALAAEQRGTTETTAANDRKKVAIRQCASEVECRLIQAEAAALRIRCEADAHFARVSVAAEATLYRKTKEAEGVRSAKEAEAAGLAALAKALVGEGGRNVVKLEYAKALAGVVFDGEPSRNAAAPSRSASVPADIEPPAAMEKTE